jgi:PKD repeat protein
MKRSVVAALALTVMVAACSDLSGPPTAPPLPSQDRGAGGVIAGDYIVVFRDNVGNAPALARQLAAAHGGTIGFTYSAALKGFSATLPEQAAEALARNPNVAFIEADQIVTATADVQTPATWGLDRSDQRSRPLDNSYNYGATGAGVTVYILDTGIRTTHQDFGGRASGGYDAVTSGGSANDCNGHGTHVAGTVGGTTWGIAKEVSLVAVRVLGCSGSGSLSGVIAGVDWVTANHAPPAAANMSLGSGASLALDNAVSNSIAAGVTYAVAAGNGNRGGKEQDACGYSPARVPAALTVGASTSTDQKTSWSNFGNCVDLFAPGSGITSAWYTSNSATNTISGTSMASPHVAGAAALYLETNPGALPAQVGSAIVNAATQNIVTSSSTSNNHLLHTFFDGSTPPPVNQPPVASFTVSCNAALECAFTNTSSDPDGSIDTHSWDFGDESGSADESPAHTFNSAGIYTVELTVTDNEGSTSTASQNVQVGETSPPPAGLTLAAVAFKVKGLNSVELSWSGTSAANVAIFRNGDLIATTQNDGSHTDSLATRGGGSATYRVCEAGTNTCSADVPVAW